MKRPAVARRDILKALGLGAGMLPLLHSGVGFGQVATFPKRLLIMLSTNGYVRGTFNPAPGFGTDLTQATLPETTKPLEPWKDKLLWFPALNLNNGIQVDVAGHEAYSCPFSGSGSGGNFKPNGATVDQFIGDEVAKNEELSLKSLALACQVDRSDSKVERIRSFWRGRDQPVTPELNPFKAASAIFSGRTPDSQPDPNLERIWAERRSILDYVGRDLERFSANMGTEDKRKCEAHLTGVREVEKRFVPGGGGSIVKCSDPTTGTPTFDHMANDNYPMTLDLHSQVAVQSLVCGVTRVATIQLGDSDGDQFIFSWLGIEGGGLNRDIRDWHDFAHVPEGRDGTNEKVKADQWLISKFAAVLEMLDRVPEGAGTALDNTAVLFANHMETGGGHGLSRVPFIIGGSCGGFFKTGFFADATTEQPHTPMLTALCHAMGFPVNHFGDRTETGNGFDDIRA